MDFERLRGPKSFFENIRENYKGSVGLARPITPRHMGPKSVLGRIPPPNNKDAPRFAGGIWGWEVSTPHVPPSRGPHRAHARPRTCLRAHPPRI